MSNEIRPPNAAEASSSLQRSAPIRSCYTKPEIVRLGDIRSHTLAPTRGTIESGTPPVPSFREDD